MKNVQDRRPKLIIALIATFPLWTALLYVLSALASRACLDNMSAVIVVFLGIVPLIAVVFLTVKLLLLSDMKRK